MLNGQTSGREVTVPSFKTVDVRLDAGSGKTSITQEQNCRQPKGVAAPSMGSGGSGAPAVFQANNKQNPTNYAPNRVQDFDGKSVPVVLNVSQPDDQIPPGFEDSKQRVPFLFNDCDKYVTGRPFNPQHEVDPFDHYCCAGDGTKIGPLRNPDPGTDKAAPRGALCHALHPVTHVYVGCTVCY
jgi:hypothetical protein